MDLLTQHCPLFHKDRYEQEVLMNMNTYVATGKFVADSTCTGYVAQMDQKTLLHYFFYYPKDDGMRVFGLGTPVDAHQYDLEHIIVERTGAVVTGVCYFPHASAESFWIRGDNDLSQLLVQGHPAVYASRGKHASYPVSGTIFRYGGFANDHIDPVLVPISVVQASDQLLAVDLIDNKFPAIRHRITGDFSTVPTVTLASARYHMMFKMPAGSHKYIALHLKLIGSATIGLTLLTAIIILVVEHKKFNRHRKHARLNDYEYRGFKQI